MTIEQIKAKRTQLYKELAIVKQQYKQEQYRLMVKQSQKTTIDQDLTRWLKSRSGVSRESISNYTTRQLYDRYIKNTHKFKHITPIAFNRAMKRKGLTIETIRKGQSVIRIFSINS